ncbi:MAG TPA: hypothetical protein VG225_17920 [Terracidiphilus sp.]|jgi:hypothetical protein|nr:hypothetical protein [Terracidiphilus sp.]
MKKLIAMMMTVAMVAAYTPAGVAEEMDAVYRYGTESAIADGSAGKLDTSSMSGMNFHAGSAQFSIPWSGIERAKYCETNRFRLGVLGAIAVGLVKARSKRHLVTLTWNDEHAVAQTVTFEVSKEKSAALWSALRVRGPQLNLKEMASTCASGWPN